MKKFFFIRFSLVLCLIFIGTVFCYAQKYEAENATYGGGAYFGNGDSGCSGTGFVGNFNANGNYVQFSITGAKAGNQDVYLRSTTGIPGSLNLYVNGTLIGPVNIPTTGGWSNWQDYAVNVTLNAGDNTIKFQHDEVNSGFYYIDCLTLVESNPVTDTKQVVFMGNSITQFWGTSHPVFFVENPYINRGISGQTTPQMLARFRDDVIALKPAAVVIEGGTNDIAGNTGYSTIEQIQNNLIAMAQLAKTNGIQVVLSSVLPADHYSWSPNVQPIEIIISLNKLIKSYAEENGMIYADFYSPLVNEQKGMKQEYTLDGVHPNLAGYEIMEPIVKEAINKAISLTGTKSIYGENEDFEVFPNPVSGSALSIKLPEGAVNFNIINAAGKIIYKKQVKQNRYIIDNSVFKENGIYMVNVFTSVKSLSKKIIISK